MHYMQVTMLLRILALLTLRHWKALFGRKIENVLGKRWLWLHDAGWALQCDGL